jgi:hypothetical protein
LALCQWIQQAVKSVWPLETMDYGQTKLGIQAQRTLASKTARPGSPGSVFAEGAGNVGHALWNEYPRWAVLGIRGKMEKNARQIVL